MRAKLVFKCVPTGRKRGYGERGRDFLPERWEEEDVGGGIRGREGMVAVNNMIKTIFEFDRFKLLEYGRPRQMQMPR